jgi:hypothetical protein
LVVNMNRNKNAKAAMLLIKWFNVFVFMIFTIDF